MLQNEHVTDDVHPEPSVGGGDDVTTDLAVQVK